jgi:predicted phosphate transport protein (TIGR00153 family)
MWPFPKKFDFYKRLSDQARKVEEGMEALRRYAHNPSEENGRRVDEIEKEADELRRILIAELNEAFVTPIDREDIFSLSRVIDDICDYGKSTVEEMMLFQVGTNEHIKEMTQTLYDASRDIAEAVDLMKDHPKRATEHLVRAKKTENRMEHLYREALAELFKTSDVVAILKLREIYRHLSNAADRGDEAADIIGDILVKTT